MDFGKEIKKLRVQNKMSQEDLADALGVSRQAVSKWETGLTTPDSKNILQLAKLFGVSADELIENKCTAEKKAVREKYPFKVLLLCLALLAVAVGIWVGFAWRQGAAEEKSGAAEHMASASQSQATYTEDPIEHPANSESSDREDVESSADSAARDVYIAFTALTQEQLSPEEEYACRETIFKGLQAIDWKEYGELGEADQYYETITELQNWLAGQQTLSKEEILGLQLGCLSNLDGAYSESYANALANALLLYPKEFVEALSAGEAQEQNSDTVISLTAYGAVAPQERYQTIQAELEYLIKRSGALDEASEKWAKQLYDKMLALY